MSEWADALFNTVGFMPHGHCYLWTPPLVWLHVISDAFITLAYYSIPITLAWFVRKRKDIDFRWMFVCFAIFILACGTTHLIEVWNIWHSAYWLAGGVKALTALASIPTAFLLTKLMPQALKLPSPSELKKANVAMENEVRTRREAEEMLLQVNEDLERSVRRRTADLEAANKELEAFSYSVAHDLRAPLRAIDGYSRILLEDYQERLDEEGKEVLEVVRSETIRMAQLVDELLEFARLGRQPIASSPTPIDVKAAAEKAFAEACNGQSGRAIDLKIDGELAKAKGDPTLLYQVLANLLGNAVKFTGKRPNAEVQVGSRVENTETVYWVKDNGVGFNPKYTEKLFRVFQRLHLQDEFEGTGVGLAIVRRIIERHGGRVWAEAELDRGATFYFSLPLNPRTS